MGLMREWVELLCPLQIDQCGKTGAFHAGTEVLIAQKFEVVHQSKGKGKNKASYCFGNGSFCTTALVWNSEPKGVGG